MLENCRLLPKLKNRCSFSTATQSGVSSVMPVLIGTYTVPSNSNPRFTPSAPYNRRPPPPKFAVTCSTLPSGASVMADAPPVVAATGDADTLRLSAPNVPVVEDRMSRPAAVPPAHDPLCTTTRDTTPVAPEVAPVTV